MHEWALAEGIISAAVKFSEEQDFKEIIEIVVKIGELQQIEHDVLKFALEELRRPPLQNTNFVFDSIPGRLKCRVCGEEWEFNPEKLTEDMSEAIHFVPEVAHVYVRCPDCESPDFEVIEGRGVLLASMKGIKKDE